MNKENVAFCLATSGGIIATAATLYIFIPLTLREVIFANSCDKILAVVMIILLIIQAIVVGFAVWFVLIYLFNWLLSFGKGDDDFQDSFFDND